MCSNVDDFNNRNLFLTAKLLKQGYRYHKIRKAFSKFYHGHSKLIVKYNIGLKTLLQQGISESIFYGDLVYKFKRIVGKPNFSDQFKKILVNTHYHNSNLIWRTVSRRVDVVIPLDHPRRVASRAIQWYGLIHDT